MPGIQLELFPRSELRTKNVFSHGLKFLGALLWVGSGMETVLSFSRKGLKCGKRTGHSGEHGAKGKALKHQSSLQGTFTDCHFSTSQGPSSVSTNGRRVHIAARKHRDRKDNTAPKIWVVPVPLSLGDTEHTIQIVFEEVGSATESQWELCFGQISCCA